ncbi:MAG: hypothetical protein ACREOS_02635 [Candidatus Dormibacteraceae bacterium]
MQTASSSRRLSDLALSTAWSLWSELGVSGWERRHQSEAIDLEPLIPFTAWLGRQDHRLLDESLDWCISNVRFISATRLRGLLKQADSEIAAAFGDYSATVTSKVPKVNWPGEGKARRFTPSEKSDIPSLERPALLQLRLRALFGVGTRAEVLRLLLIDVPRGRSAADLARESGYAKVNVAAALDLLALAGIVRIEKSGNQFRYRLGRGPQLVDLAGPLPRFQPDWSARLAVMLPLARLELDGRAGEGMARAAHLVGLLRQIENPLRRLGLREFVPTPGRPEFTEGFDLWSEQLLGYWAGEEVPAGPAGSVYEVHRTDIAWEAMVHEAGRAPLPLTLPDWEDLYKERPRSDYTISDDSSGALLLAHELMRRAFTRSGVAIEPFRYQPEVIAFAEEHLRTVPRGQSRRFSDAFLRLWRAERLGRMTLVRGA